MSRGRNGTTVCRKLIQCDGPASGAQQRPARAVPAFLELAAAGQLAAVAAGGCECTLELEDVHGAKVRVQLKAAQPPDLAALSRSFWNPAS